MMTDKTAKQIIDLSSNQYHIYTRSRAYYYVTMLIIGLPLGIFISIPMFIVGSLFIILKLIVQHIIIDCYYNPKIDMSPLFVKQPSERQPLLTNTIV